MNYWTATAIFGWGMALWMAWGMWRYVDRATRYETALRRIRALSTDPDSRLLANDAIAKEPAW